MRWSAWYRSTCTLAYAIAAVQGCSSSNGGPSGTGGSITLSLVPSAATVLAGSQTLVVATVTRSGGFSGSVSVTVEGAPTGITASLSQSVLVGSVSVTSITFAALTSVAAGSHSVTIRATGSGVSDATVTLPLSVTTGVADFGLAFIPQTISIPAGGRDSVIVLTARAAAFNGTISLALQSAATGITVTFNPTSTTGPSGIQARVHVNVAASVAPGPYSVAIKGSSPGQPDFIASLALQVTPGTGSGNVTIDLSACTPIVQVLWVAGQDGNGAWTRLTGANEVYRFNVTSGKGGLAWVTTSANAQALDVHYATQAEFTAAVLTPCRILGTRQITGTTTGLAANEFVSLSLGNDHALSTQASPGFFFTGAREGVRDLIATRWHATDGTPQRQIIRRDLSIAANGSLPALDFSATSTTAFAPQAASMTITNVLSNESLLMATGYLTGATCDVGLVRSFGGNFGAGTTRIATAHGIPAAQRRTTDYHQFAATTSQDNLFNLMADFPPTVRGFSIDNAGRTMRVFYQAHGDRTVALGSRMTADPTITALPAAYKRLQAAFTIPADYQSSATFAYGNLGNRSQVVINASFGWLGSAAATMVTPDLTGVSGFNTSWLPTPTPVNRWSVTVTGTNLTGSQCVEGGFIRTERRVGTM